MIPANEKNKDRNPRMAKAFDVKTIKVSVVIASMAGTESTANMISVVSTRIRTKNRGVANHFPCCFKKNLLPSL